MIKANRKWMTGCGIAVWASLGIVAASSSFAADAPTTDAVVQGQAQFERRSTMIPMVVCEDGSPCVRPSSYWVLVLHSNGARFELQQPLAVGMDRAPSQVELAGIQLHSGSEVELEGEVEKVSSNYSIVTQVKRVQLMRPTGELSSDAHNQMKALFPTANVEGWQCRSTEQERDSVVVQIWYGAEPDGFRMQLSARSPAEGGRVAREATASFDKVTLFREPKNAYFTATGAHQTAWLRVRNDQQLFVQPAELRVVDESSELPIAGHDVSMNCTRSISN